MFGRRHSGRRHTNVIFVIFRLFLSLIMFALLLGGVYSAYKHFSGVDPLKADPMAIVSQITALIPSVKSIPIKIPQNILGQTQQAAGIGKMLFKFMIVADSHNDNESLSKAIFQAKKSHPDLAFIIGLGDYTDVGTKDELKKAKQVFDSSGLRYFLIPGDHDFWEARENGEADSNFREIFGPTYQAFDFEGFKFLTLNNSDNYLGVDEQQMVWIGSELEKAKTDSVKGIYVFLHEPLFHPSSDRVMGKVDSKLKQQAQSLILQFKTAGVKKIFSGDIHYFSEYPEPATALPMVTVGAITKERNPQAPRFAVGYMFGDGTVRVEDVEIK
ncbi:MAG: Metallophosphoesterase [Microgenomates group bacterium Gr01-1014_7]|nr:MAG: Metallophosphoesterase [Microgenomates group bacterium Gr01-1014_7]